MGGSNSCNKDLHGPAKIMVERYGDKATKYLPEWHSNLGFPQNGSFSHALLHTLRKKLAKSFEEKIKNGKLSACKKLNDKWAKQLASLNLWEAEADCRSRVETTRANVKEFVSLTADEAIDKISNVCPKALVDEVTGTRHYTTPFCDYVSDFNDTWPRNGSFERSHIALLRKLINPPLQSGSADWDYSYMEECVTVWDTIGRKVNHTDSIIKSRPKISMLSVHKVDELLDCPVRAPSAVQQQLAPPPVAPQGPVSPVSLLTPPRALDPFGASVVSQTLTPTLAPPLYSDLMNQVQAQPTPSPHSLRPRKSGAFFPRPVTPHALSPGSPTPVTPLTPGSTRSGLQYQSEASPDMLTPPAEGLEGAVWVRDVEGSLFAPMIECPNGQGGIQRVYRPWKVTELQAIVGSLPNPKNNGKMFATALKKMAVQCSPTAAEIEHVCVTKMGLLWSDVKPAAWDSTVAWSNDNQSAYQTQLTALAAAFEAKFKPVINMTMVNSCVQKPGETFDDYFVRKLPVFNAHSGNEQPADIATDSPWERQFIQTLVDGLLPAVREIFVRHCVSWQSARMDEVKKYCLHADTVVKEEITVQSKKSKATGERLQMAQLDYYAPTSRGRSDQRFSGQRFSGQRFTGRGRARGRGRGWGNRQAPAIVCWNCNKPGHRAAVCTANASDVTSRPPSSQVTVNQPFGPH